MNLPTRTTALLLVLLLPALLAGCGEQPDEEAPGSAELADQLPEGHPPISPPMGLPVPRSEGPGLSWTAPASWVEETPANPVRRAQYRIPGPGGDAECVVFYFGAGEGGDARANAERWADQFLQPDGSPSREALEIEETELGGRSTLLASITGTYQSGMMMVGQEPELREGYMLLGAVVEGPDANWFFKLTGPEATVSAHEEALREMLASIREEG